jgi:hypothetical protein
VRSAVLAAALLVARAETPPLPEGNAYVRGLTEKQSRREELLDLYTYDTVEERDELDDAGHVKQRRRRRYETFFVLGRPLRRLVEEDGRPLSPERQAREDADARALAEAVRSGRAVVERPGVRLSAILGRYDFRATGREEVAGRTAIVLEFTPRPGPRELENDRLLRQVHGRLWVDEQETEVVRAEVANVAPLKIGLGLKASVSTFSTRIEFRKVDDSVWLPAEDETLAAGRAMLFKKFRTRVRRTYSSYRRFSVDSEEKASPS